ncbi:TPA: hypothetical protein ACH3X1_011905 [Trebouxia sp. C0004]
MMTDEQLWLAYVELQEGCMYLSDAIPMRFQAGRPTVPMALLWLASQHTIKLKQLPRSGALPPSGPFTQFRAFLPSLFGRSWAPKDGAQDRLMIPVLRQVAQPDDPKPGMIYAKPEQTSHSYPLLEFDPHSKPIGRGTSGTMWQGLVFGQCAAVKVSHRDCPDAITELRTEAQLYSEHTELQGCLYSMLAGTGLDPI